MTIETVKLINDSGKVIERSKLDYENNINALTRRGWKLHDSKKVAKPVSKPVSKPVKQAPKSVKKVAKKKKTKK
tara:strand:- start:516 stop:737 length:222 start_codon:yes stop_codon:yes gene_type:complete